MKKSKFTEEQIAFALKQADTGISVDEVCRKMSIDKVRPARQLFIIGARSMVV
jgi:hypothetical protein